MVLGDSGRMVLFLDVSKGFWAALSSARLSSRAEPENLSTLEHIWKHKHFINYANRA